MQVFPYGMITLDRVVVGRDGKLNETRYLCLLAMLRRNVIDLPQAPYHIEKVGFRPWGFVGRGISILRLLQGSLQAAHKEEALVGT